MIPSLIDLQPKTKEILAYNPEFTNVWVDNINPPIIKDRKPHEVCWYMKDTFTPTARWVDGEMVEHNPLSPDEPYRLLVVADDQAISLSVGEQSLFDYSNLVDLPEFKLTRIEDELTEAEAELERLLALRAKAG